MTQYNVIKSKHPDAILLFRVGDFYETFGEDAIITSKILGIVLTNRANGSSKIELSGFPHHSLETYLPKLVRAGKRVAICDQLEDPKKTKGIVKRGVTELVTPGVAFNDLVLESKRNNFLASLYYSNNQKLGISFLDVSTGEFLLAEGDEGYIKKLIQGLNPSEIIFQKSKSNHVNNNYKETIHLFTLDDWVYSEDLQSQNRYDADQRLFVLRTEGNSVCISRFNQPIVGKSYTLLRRKIKSDEVDPDFPIFRIKVDQVYNYVVSGVYENPRLPKKLSVGDGVKIID